MTQRLDPGILAGRTTPTRTTRTGLTPTKTDCERAGCLQHCACEPSDPWLYALGGAAVGTVVGATVLYFVGRNKRR